MISCVVFGGLLRILRTPVYYTPLSANPPVVLCPRVSSKLGARRKNNDTLSPAIPKGGRVPLQLAVLHCLLQLRTSLYYSCPGVYDTPVPYGWTNIETAPARTKTSNDLSVFCVPNLYVYLKGGPH